MRCPLKPDQGIRLLNKFLVTDQMKKIVARTRNKGIEKTKPDSIVAEARADEFIWFNLNKTLFEYA